ncbi:MAG: helix-turn-helix domain-containing protein [Rhodocyclaceae bacterium]
MKTFDIKDAAAFLHISVDSLGDLAGNGTVPAAKVGKAWVFSDECLEAYLREEITRQTTARRKKTPDAGRAHVPTAHTRTVRRKPATPPTIAGLCSGG